MTLQAVLAFWFGPPPLAVRAEWFRKDPAFDDRIRAQFGAAVDAALDSPLPGSLSARDTLAHIVLRDQFPRNLYRGQARAFAGDPAALALARRLIADDSPDSGHLSLHPLERWFVYLPLEHAEDLALQDQCVALFQALAAATPGFAEALRYAQAHRDVIARYGRFPHRNAALGRTSTPDEQAYLATPGAGF